VEAFRIRNTTPLKGTTLSTQQRSDVVRRIKAMPNEELIAYYRNTNNTPYFRGKAMREIVQRKLLTVEELKGE